MKHALGWHVVMVTFGLWTTTAAVPACSDDTNGTVPDGGPSGDAQAGGASGSGGKGAGGKGAGGNNTGGSSSGGQSGAGGRATGGSSSGGAPMEGGADAGCVPPNYLVYRAPGCDETVEPQCVAPPRPPVDAGLTVACGCDGKVVLGGNGFVRPYRHLGECPDASTTTDAGKDAP